MSVFRSTIFYSAVTISVFLMPIRVFAEVKSDPPFSTEIGFHKVSDQSTPEFIRIASESVFEIRTFAETSSDQLIVRDLTLPENDDLEERINALPELHPQEKIILNLQVKRCRESEDPSQCVLRATIQKGTAFLAGGDGSILWTNAHLIDQFMVLRSTYEETPIREILQTNPRLPVFLFDKEGNLVFNPFEDDAEFLYGPRLSPYAESLAGWYGEDTDFVGIKLSRSMGRPLEIGAIGEINESLYKIGFPACTGCPDNANQTDPLLNNSRAPFQDSDGSSMYWTNGTRLESSALFSFVSPYYHSLLAELWLDQMVFLSQDSQVGFSGSPIVNDRREVVGVFAGSLPKMYGDEMLVLSRGVRPPVFDELMERQEE